MTPGPLQNYACGRLDWPFLSQVLAVTVMQKADRHSSDAAGYIPMKNQVGKAMRVLRSRLYDQERAANRKSQVGSGDRLERIRTYNFPQGRVTDHRVNLRLYKIDKVMVGEALDEIIDALVSEDEAISAGVDGMSGWPYPAGMQHRLLITSKTDKINAKSSGRAYT